MRFAEIALPPSVASADGWTAGVAAADVDVDDDVDIYVCRYDAPNQLLINDGRANFRDHAAEFGVDTIDASLMAAFMDYDRDGDLDMYLLTYRYYRDGGRPNAPPWKMVDGRPKILSEYDRFYAVTETSPGQFGVEEYGRSDYLYRNRGDGTFEDVTQQAGVAGYGHGLSCSWWDYDDDGWPDLYVCNDFDDPDCLYRNRGDGTFENVLAKCVPHTSWSSMGSDFGDINNDGWFDYLSADMSGTDHYKQKTTMGAMNAEKIRKVAGPPPQVMRNALLINSGTGRFWEAAYLAGLADSNWSWAVRLFDLDNDGRLDAFISNGSTRSFNDSDVTIKPEMLVGRTHWDLYRQHSERREQNLAFRNVAPFEFTDVSHEWGLDHVSMSYAVASGDLDRDGDIDLVVANLEEPLSVYQNNVAPDNSGMMVHLRGTSSNRFGIGAKLTLKIDGLIQVRQLSPMTGFLASNEAAVHFTISKRSLTGDGEPAQLLIEWPSGVSQWVKDFDGKSRLVVVEQETGREGDERVVQSSSEPAFRSEPWLSAAVHRERPFDDFEHQPLLPNKLSQLGPGMAWGDIDGDDDDDLFLGGAAGQAGQLWIQQNHAAGQFVRASVPAFDEDAECEDMGALFFDVDSDGDLDLYVVSGGVEVGTSDPRMQDRLYINDGGAWVTDREALDIGQPQSGSVVCAADFDRDSDLDLFVGGRVIPGQYPMSPVSAILVNQSGRLVNKNEELAPDLSRTGLVTCALWSDVDSDGWVDLLVGHEWGPFKLFRNRQGRLVDGTAESGLSEMTGWWNSISGCDIDADGDIDYCVGNFGLNTKYHASSDHPATLFYGDFENAGHMHLIEAEFEGNRLLPLRGRSCSTRAMPFLSEKFSSYHEFAIAELDQLYTEECLERAMRFEARVLESGVLLNDGKGRFQFRAFPRLAQISPVFGIVTGSLVAGRGTDVYVTHNFFHPQIETGRMDGGLSLMQRNEGGGRLTPVPPIESGIEVAGDARGAAIVDLNRDGWPDVVVAQNDGPLLAFASQGNRSAPKPLIVQLQGLPGNTEAVGSRATVEYADGGQQTAEVYAGAGYLTQEPSKLWFAGASNGSVSLRVRWPNGAETAHKLPERASGIVMLQAPAEAQ